MNLLPIIYTIGHSTHPAEHFLKLLTTNQVNCVVDVRSVAASRFNPQYNKKALEDFLKKNGIRYLHFAEEFGARRTDPNDLSEGLVDFEKVRQSAVFKKGIERLKQGTEKGYSIALMCAESEPLECHRFAMISPALKEEGFEIKHILKNNTIQSQEKSEAALLDTYKKQLNLLFADELPTSNRLQIALKLMNEKMGFTAK
ncbi:MAG: hypothetical protein K0S33_3351 [Bacteroidetes bacterium]|jgi:uncharacterized protein (DUF488 family)|nr:hypothetical protein [Bacteroidota bacterium]